MSLILTHVLVQCDNIERYIFAHATPIYLGKEICQSRHALMIIIQCKLFSSFSLTESLPHYLQITVYKLVRVCSGVILFKCVLLQIIFCLYMFVIAAMLLVKNGRSLPLAIRE